MIKLTRYLSVNPANVVSAEIEHRHYMNGSDTRLKIVMTTGGEYVIDHNPHMMDGVDVYEIKRWLEEDTSGEKAGPLVP